MPVTEPFTWTYMSAYAGVSCACGRNGVALTSVRPGSTARCASVNDFVGTTVEPSELTSQAAVVLPDVPTTQSRFSVDQATPVAVKPATTGSALPTVTAPRSSTATLAMCTLPPASSATRRASADTASWVTWLTTTPDCGCRLPPAVTTCSSPLTATSAWL